MDAITGTLPITCYTLRDVFVTLLLIVHSHYQYEREHDKAVEK
jgi:hypothetical protein